MNSKEINFIYQGFSNYIFNEEKTLYIKKFFESKVFFKEIEKFNLIPKENSINILINPSIYINTKQIKNNLKNSDFILILAFKIVDSSHLKFRNPMIDFLRIKTINFILEKEFFLKDLLLRIISSKKTFSNYRYLKKLMKNFIFFDNIYIFDKKIFKIIKKINKENFKKIHYIKINEKFFINIAHTNNKFLQRIKIY